jgi:hypothetical protein
LSFLGPNILLNTLFSNICIVRSSLSVSDQISHPYTTTDKIVVLCICRQQPARQKTLYRVIASTLVSRFRN